MHGQQQDGDDRQREAPGCPQKRRRWHVGSTDQPTNAWIQKLGIIGIFDDDRSLWVGGTLMLSLYHFTPGNLDTPRHPARGENTQLRPHPSPIGPQISPDSANAHPLLGLNPCPPRRSMLMQGQSCLRRTAGSKTRVEASRKRRRGKKSLVSCACHALPEHHASS